MSAVSARKLSWSTSRAQAFYELTKPTIVMLVLITGLPAVWWAGGARAPLAMLGALVGTALAAASSGVLNHWYDRDLDGRMSRTSDRPLPSGRVLPGEALRFAMVLAALSMAVLLATTNGLAAALALGSILWYGGLYTMWLKRRTPHNIVIGGAAGASAPLIGWAAVTGSLALPAWLMAGVVFLWTPAHFWALALYRCREYDRVGLPMWPVVRGEVSTRRWIGVYAALTVACSLVLGTVPGVGLWYQGPALALGAWLGWRSWALLREANEAQARKLFAASIGYLLVLFMALSLDRWVGSGA